MTATVGRPAPTYELPRANDAAALSILLAIGLCIALLLMGRVR